MTPQVIDLSHWQCAVDFAAVKASGVQGCIVKATQGVLGTDPQYRAHIDGARAAGLLVGSYHFGTGDSGVDQADHFLKTADWNGLMVLDFEDNPHNQMGIDQAQDFVNRIAQKTGKFPGIYFDMSHLVELRNALSIVENCWHWVAKYSAVAPDEYSLWQFTDKFTGEPGKLFDASVFNSQALGDIAAWWDAHSHAAVTQAESNQIAPKGEEDGA